MTHRNFDEPPLVLGDLLIKLCTDLEINISSEIETYSEDGAFQMLDVDFYLKPDQARQLFEWLGERMPWVK